MDLIIMLTGPALFWAAYHYYKDRHRPEPFPLLIMMFALGVVAGFVANMAYVLLAGQGLIADVEQLALSDRPRLLIYSIVVIGGLEELVKFAPFYMLAIRHAHFNERLDGIIYASFIALGFATFENFYYLQVLDGVEALGRAVASPVVHVMFASIWGYATGRAIISGGNVLVAIIGGLVVAALAHGLFDYFTFGVNAWYRLGPPVLVAVIWAWRMRLFHQVKTDSPGG